MQENWDIKFITDWNEIYSLEFQKQWLQWVEESVSSHVFFHPALGMAWLDTYRPIRNLKPLFCIARYDDNICFLPLVLWRQNWKNAFRNIIVPVGYPDFDYSDPLTKRIVAKGDWDLFWHSFIDAVHKNFNYDSICIDGLHLNNYGHKFTLSKSATSPFLDLKEKRGPGEILKDISVKQYKEVYRKYKKLSEIGKVEIIQFEYNDLNKTLSELGDMLEIHRRQWPSAYKAPDFHNNLVSYGLKSGIMHFTALKVNDYTISWRICFIFRKRYYSYMPAMRQEYRQYSPGKYHQFFCIDYAYRNEFEIFDFLRGSEKYKGLFTNESEIIGGFESKNSSMQSMFKNTIVGIKNRLL